MRILFILGWILLGLAFFAGAADVVPRTLTRSGGGIVSAHDLWYALSPETFLVAEIRIQRLFGDWIWDLVILTILKLPAWLLVGGPGAALMFFSPNRSPHSREEIAQVNESYALYDELTKRAMEENPPGEEHGPRDILPENPIDDDEIINDNKP